GRAHLGRDLEQQPAQVALVANLRSAAYVRVLCGSLDHLPAALAALDSEASAKPTALVRDHRGKKLRHYVRKLLAVTAPPSTSRSQPVPAPAVTELTPADLASKCPEMETPDKEVTGTTCNGYRFFQLADSDAPGTNRHPHRKPVPITV
ncbi:MAG: hypothetical protein KAY24_02170, partial [Candidatus Eisenbacteria sp.]|nr:hypothetical protein [Candidatus Eisenbacteria bacterium]